MPQSTNRPALTGSAPTTRSARRAADLLVVALQLLLIVPAHATTLTGTAVAVSDGDTITVLDAHHEQHKIRVAGIDAPEKSQPFGQRSKESLSAMVFGKKVDVHWHKQDRYKRIVGKVMVAAPSCRAIPCPKTLDAGHAHGRPCLVVRAVRQGAVAGRRGAVRVRPTRGGGEEGGAVGRWSPGTAVGLAEGRTLMEPRLRSVPMDEEVGIVIPPM